MQKELRTKKMIEKSGAKSSTTDATDSTVYPPCYYIFNFTYRGKIDKNIPLDC
jgi:hypothetical protein